MRATIFAAGAALALGLGPGTRVEEGPKPGTEQVCKARADEQQITADLRETYMRECLAGERLNQTPPPAK